MNDSVTTKKVYIPNRYRRYFTGLITLLFIQILLIPHPISADSNNRPKIGLALSGGGAKGVAHVGVLKVLEELNVPVDYIAATSMGALVGGLYASGMSTEELENIVLTMDWDDIMQDKPQRDYLSFRRKEDDQRYLFDLELGIKWLSVEMPSGLRSGQKLNFLLRSLTLPVTGITDFDEFPIPFRAVATNIVNGEPVVLDHGDLVETLRASMAIPGVFSPVVMDGLLLIDGGPANNIPVDVARAMGADIVIAIDISSQLADRDELKSLFSISIQTIDLLTRKNMESQLEQADLVITPPVAGFGTMEFSAVKEIIRLGYEDALSKRSKLDDYAVDPAEYNRLKNVRTRRKKPDLNIDAIRFEGNQLVDKRIIESMVHVQPGETIDLEQLADDISLVFGLGDFQSIYYTIEQSDGQSVLVINATEKPWGPHYLHFGLTLDSNLDGKSSFSILCNITNTRLNSLGAELRTDLLIGKNRKIFSEFYQPMDYTGRFFLAPGFEYRHDFTLTTSETGGTSEYENRTFTGRLDFGYMHRRYSELRLGLEIRRDKYDLRTGLMSQGLYDVTSGFLTAGIRIDRLNSVSIPTDGLYSTTSAHFSLEALGSDDEYTRIETAISQFKSFGNHTLLGSIKAGFSPGNELPVYDKFEVGGFFSFSGYEENALHGDKYGIARLGYYYHLDHISSGFASKIFIGGWFDAGNVLQRDDDFKLNELIYSTTAFLGADTVLGPLYLGYGFAEGGENHLYLILGKAF